MLRSNAVHFLILSALAFSGCARSNSGAITASNLDTGIVNGTKAAADSAFAKQVARLQIEAHSFLSDPGKSQTVRCTGTFISPHIVLTAAHCIAQTNPSKIEINIGSDLSSKQFQATSTKWIVHESFVSSSQTPEFDLALIWTSTPFPANDVVIPLAHHLPSAKVSAEAAGFGLTYYPEHAGPQPGLDSYVRSVTFSRLKVASSDFWFKVKIGLGGGLSHGDSGGPLFADVDGVKAQIGVASSIANDYDGGDVVYTSVPANLNWILSTSKTLEAQQANLAN